MNTKHTPTPWKAQIETNSNGIVKTFIVGDRYIGEVFNWAKPSTSSYVQENETLNQEAQANAAFIVRAVNNFDQMLDALKDARDRLDYYQDPLAHAIKQVIANTEKE